MLFVKATVATLIAFLVIDLLWIGFVAKGVYAAALGDWMKASPALLPAGVFYIFYAMGMVYFAVQPTVPDRSIGSVLFAGAALGGLAYGTFTITNFAVLKRWTVTLAVTDIGWGIAVTAMASLVGHWAIRGYS